MKKIVFVISSLGSGGAERVVSVLSNEFIEREIKVTVVMVNNSNIYYPISNDIKIVKLESAQYDSLPFMKRFSKRIKLLREAIREENPDVVISFLSEINIDVCIAMRGMKTPLIVSERNDPAIDPPSKIKKILRKIVYKRAQGFVFQTEDAKAYFSKAIQRRSSVIFNPLTVALPDVYSGKREKRIVAVGRLNKQKNYQLLLSAFSEIVKRDHEITLDIYGEGVMLDQLEKFAKDQGVGDNTIFHGFCADVHDRIRNAALFVMSSDYEGMPNALIEAMALGLPCISTDCPCGGPKTIIQNGVNGLLVSVNNREQMVNAIEYMLSHPNEADSMGIRASEIRNNLSLELIANQWLEFTGSIIDDRTGKNKTVK